ncbi:SgcJ/EcaC family oxidoreductase (plasmid) [Streptomyces sp. NBC_00726]|uniref:SgcJ/EcaC family oxidoreductase n=1 Tax=Streptomyces sp. NBC_00726 TaxID=2903674 RepID=UPI002F9075A1
MSTDTNAAPGTTEADMAAIAALTQKVIAAWAYNDAESFANLFVEEGTMILPGMFAKGRDAIHSYLAESFAGQYKGTQVTGRPLDLRLLGADSGILLTEGGVLPAGHTEVPDEQSIRASWVVVRRDGEWRLAAYQNSHARLQLPAPGGAA